MPSAVSSSIASPRRRISTGLSALLLISTPRRSTTFQCRSATPSSRPYDHPAAPRTIPRRPEISLHDAAGCGDADVDQNLARIVATIRSDYPGMLRSAPDYGIYADGLVAADPKGFTVVGIGAYERAIRFLHVFVDTFYDVEASGLTFTLVYDWARGDIRVSWHASVMPKSLFATEPLRVDGISVYDYSPSSGKILSHTIDNVSINDVGVRPERIIFESVPFASFPECTALGSAEGSGVSGARGISHHAQHNLPRRSPATARLSTARPATSLSACTDDTTEVLEAFISKNRARASFGLPALSRAEFDEVNEKVNRLSDKRAARNAEMAGGRPASAGMRSMIDNFVRDVMKDATGPESCESSWDCESPKNCCDLGFAKICCYSGLGAMSEPAAILEPIPVRVTDGYSYPDHFPENRRGPAGY